MTNSFPFCRALPSFGNLFLILSMPLQILPFIEAARALTGPAIRSTEKAWPIGAAKVQYKIQLITHDDNIQHVQC